MPERVSAVGLISAAAPLDGVRDPDYRYRTHRVASRAADYAPWMIRIAMWRWAHGQRTDPERHLVEAIESMVEADRTVLEDPQLRAVMLANGIELYRQGGRGLYDEALVMARPWGFPLEGISVPVLLWHGEADNTVPVGMGRHIARTIPGCRAIFYPGEAHHLLYDRWGEILAQLAATAGPANPASHRSDPRRGTDLPGAVYEVWQAESEAATAERRRPGPCDGPLQQSRSSCCWRARAAAESASRVTALRRRALP